ncbi:MAG: type II toxin-antitoxin system Phd/YefM family antitoxin [Candidatus Methanoplasma sp.]|jgi:prevent-host-death family protein|nr:type II toxin-antitoxin system Phd/YefM family antitoxin [Candidatus Methanoplasma sp.]
MTIINVTQARSNLYKIVDSVLDDETVTIVSKRGNVVMISENDWEGIKETLYLMGDPEFAKDVAEARNTPLSEREVWN